MRDLAYLAWIREFPCDACGKPPPSQAHHVTFGRGMGQKASDRQTLPLCADCHRQFHDGNGQFRKWRRSQRLVWQRERSQEYQMRKLAAEDPGVF